MAIGMERGSCAAQVSRYLLLSNLVTKRIYSPLPNDVTSFVSAANERNL